jgi:hypothetical protein
MAKDAAAKDLKAKKRKGMQLSKISQESSPPTKKNMLIQRSFHTRTRYRKAQEGEEYGRQCFRSSRQEAQRYF